MTAQIVQYLVTGITVGAIYALVALGFSLIYNASQVINFAQGEFVMIGGMSAVSLLALGLPLPLAVLGAVGVTVAVGMLLEKLAVEPARGASVTTLIIITIGASIFLRGLAAIVWDKQLHALPAFSGNAPIAFLGASVQPQSLWVLFATLLIVALLALFFGRTRVGKGMLATSHNRLAAQLVGINVKRVLMLSFAVSAGLGGAAGILVAPITTTSVDAGVMLGLKGFAAAVLGGLGSGLGALVGGFVLGIVESLTAGYISSAYKDAIAFVLMLAVLFFLPSGLLGKRSAERV
jgi:branched-chain amino acid transport system permease protein